MTIPLLSCVSHDWVRKALCNETLFSDSPPRWENLRRMLKPAMSKRRASDYTETLVLTP